MTQARRRGWLGVCAVLLTTAVLQADPLTRRVRPLSDRGARLLTVAQRLSPTIAAMVAKIEASDIILQLDTQLSLEVPFAVTRLITATADVRYVRVSINPRQSPLRRIELLGHELQHVLEIAAEPSVRDQNSMRDYFTRIGHRRIGDAFETDAATDIESVIRAEVGRWRSSELADLLK